MRMYTAVPVWGNMKLVGEGDRNFVPGAGIEGSIYLIDLASKPKVEYVR